MALLRPFCWPFLAAGRLAAVWRGEKKRVQVEVAGKKKQVTFSFFFLLSSFFFSSRQQHQQQACSAPPLSSRTLQAWHTSAATAVS